MEESVNLGEGCQFECQMCGACYGNIIINVSFSDIIRWLKEERYDILDEISYIDATPPGPGFYITKTALAPKQPCPFVKDRLCYIYETRPRACADFPHAHKTWEGYPPRKKIGFARDSVKDREAGLSQKEDFERAESEKYMLIHFLFLARDRKIGQIKKLLDPKDPTVNLWVDSLDNTWQDWVETGDPPFLNDSATDFIDSAVKKANHGWFGFQDETLPPNYHYESVYLYVEGTGNPADFHEFTIDDGTGTEVIYELTFGAAMGYQNADVSAHLDTRTKINAATLHIIHESSTNVCTIRRAYLLFTYTETDEDLLGKFDVNQSSQDLLGKINITHSVELLGKFDVDTVFSSVELLGKFEAQVTRDLFGKFEAQNTTELLASTEVRQLGSVGLLGKAVIRHVGTPVDLLGKAVIRQPGSVGLLGKAVIRHVGTPVDLLGKTVIRQPGSAELLGEFEAQAIAELLGEAEIRQSGLAEVFGKTEVKQSDSAELFGNAVIRHVGTPVEFLSKTIIRHVGTSALLGKIELRQPNSNELLGMVFIGKLGSAELLGEAVIRQPGSAELLFNFRVIYPSLMGGNWQRKMWFDGTYYWRGRYCQDDDALKFEYIAAAGLAGNVWTENAAARIDASGFTGFNTDFTVRGVESGIKTTTHYSDGVDTWVAESNEASLTGWAWQNLTKVFDGTAPDSYKCANLGADRADSQMLWVTAAFVDDGTGKQWVQTKKQTTSEDITAWDAAVAVSDVDNTDMIYGCSVRSMGVAGAEADDIMVVYKEGDALRSRYYTGTWQAIQDIDTTTLSGHAAFDFEHGELLGVDMGHVLYVDADRSIKWRERDAGAAEVWSAAEQLHAADPSHRGVGIVEHGSGWLWTIWVHGNEIEYRLHQCVPEVWYPLLAADPLIFDVSTDAVVPTITDEQPNTPDYILSGEAVPICWIGETAPMTPCVVGWGILVEYSIASLKGVLDIKQLTSTDLYARFRVRQDSAELLCKAEVQQSGSAELLAIFWIRQPYRLWTNRRYVNGVVELTETLLGNAIFEYVIEGVMQDIQSYLINAGLVYSEWTDIVLTPKLIRRATTYGTVAALYARSSKTFTTRVIPTMAPVTITAIGDEERAMNHWREKMNRALEFYVTSQGGDVMITSTDDEEPVFSMEDIPPELTDFTPWYQWLMKRTQ